MLTCGSLTAKLRGGINSRVYLPADHPLRPGESFHQVAKRDVAHNHQIYVAVVSQLVFGRRPEHERRGDAIRKRGEGIMQHVR